MRKLAASVLAAILLTISAVVSAAPPKILSSISGLQYVTRDGSMRNYCTASKINEKQGLWLTAAHCVEEEDAAFIQGWPVGVVESAPELDLAVLNVPRAGGKALELADKAVEFGDGVETAGYSLGFPQAYYFTGKVAHPLFVFPDDSQGQKFTIFDMPVIGGQSGSPVVNSKGKLVSVVQVAFMKGTFGTVSGGAPFAYVKDFAGKYFGK